MSRNEGRKDRGKREPPAGGEEKPTAGRKEKALAGGKTGEEAGKRYPFRLRFFPHLPRPFRTLLFTAALIILLAAAGIAGLSLLPKLGIDINFSLSRQTRISESDILLTRIRPLMKLTTVEYTYKSVFPYDFIPEGVDIFRAYRRYVQGEVLSADERQAAELYLLCIATGIRIWSQEYAFVVITTNVKGGYNLEEDRWPPAGTGETAVQTNPALGTVSILLPPPRITSFILRDETSSHYLYPDIDVDAEEWKKIAAYVEDRIRQRVIAEGILDKTESNLRGVITRVLKENGWEKISFRNQ
jgi:hypothetical protein